MDALGALKEHYGYFPEYTVAWSESRQVLIGYYLGGWHDLEAMGRNAALALFSSLQGRPTHFRGLDLRA